MTLRLRAVALLVGLVGCAAELLAQATPVQTLNEQYLVAAANADRASRGLGALRVDGNLIAAATLHARQMVAHGEISHQFAGEPELAARASAAGSHFSLVTENVAVASNPTAIHDLWMHSAGHRANLLDPQVDAIGVAVIERNGQFYAVEDFARTVAKMSYADQEAAVGRLIVQSGVDVAPTTEDARRTCTMETGYAGSRQPWFVMRFTAADLSRLPDQLQTRLASGKYRQAVVGAGALDKGSPFSGYAVAVLLYP